MNHKKVLMRKTYSRRFRMKDDRLKRITPKLFRLRKFRWTFKRKPFKRLFYKYSRIKYIKGSKWEIRNMYRYEDSFFYNLYRFYGELKFGFEPEFAADLNFYTKQTPLYPANNYRHEEDFKDLDELEQLNILDGADELGHFKNKLVHLTSNLSKQQKNILLFNKTNNGKFNFKIIKNKQFSIRKKQNENKSKIQPKVVQNKISNQNVKKTQLKKK